MKQLFTLSALVDDFKGYDQVPFFFFVTKRKETLPPYDRLIKDYDPIDPSVEYGKGYVNEMFTLEEATQACEYLKKTYGTEATIEAYNLPTEAMNFIPTGAIPVGGPTGMIFLDKLDGYNLPFDIWAYYDLRSAQEPSLRHKRLTFEASNQQIISLAYAIKELLTPLIESGGKLSFEQANSYYAAWHIIGKWLEKIDTEYREQHKILNDFYLNKNLSNEWDRLALTDKPKAEPESKRCTCKDCPGFDDDPF
jgi:hypothetical protein